MIHGESGWVGKNGGPGVCSFLIAALYNNMFTEPKNVSMNAVVMEGPVVKLNQYRRTILWTRGSFMEGLMPLRLGFQCPTLLSQVDSGNFDKLRNSGLSGL